MNEEAISQIRSVNSEVLDEFRRGYNYYDKDAVSTHAPKSHRGSMYDLRTSAPQEDYQVRKQLNQ